MIVGMDEFLKPADDLFGPARRPSPEQRVVTSPPATLTLPVMFAATLNAALTVGPVQSRDWVADAVPAAHIWWADRPATEASAPAFGAVFADILDAGLAPSATVAALKLVQAVAGGGPVAQVEAIPLDDEGLSVEFSAPTTGRTIWFAVSGDGARIPFVAKGPNGFRQSGILVADIGMQWLGRWLRGPLGAFPAQGLELP
jgi:hypothetical protein